MNMQLAINIVSWTCHQSPVTCHGHWQSSSSSLLLSSSSLLLSSTSGIPSTPSLLNGPNPHPTLIRMDSNSLEQAIQTVQGILNSTLTVNLNGGIGQSLTYLVTFWMQILRHVVCTSHIWFRNATNFTIYRASTILISLRCSSNLWMFSLIKHHTSF